MSSPAGPQRPHRPASHPPDQSRTRRNARTPGGKPPTQDRQRKPPGQGVPDREARDPHCLSAAAADNLLAGAPWRRFAVLGDGTAEGRGDRTPGYQDTGWADRVAAVLARCRPTPADFAYCNLASSDVLTAEVRATQLAPVLSFRPDLVLVVTGSNDIIRRDFERRDDVLADYDAIVAALQRAGAEVVTATLFDVTRSTRVPDDSKAALRRRLHRLAGWIRLVARARRTVHLDLAGHPAAADPDVYSTDIRFVTRRGHAVAAAALVRRLGEHLGNQQHGGSAPA